MLLGRGSRVRAHLFRGVGGGLGTGYNDEQRCLVVVVGGGLTIGLEESGYGEQPRSGRRDDWLACLATLCPVNKLRFGVACQFPGTAVRSISGDQRGGGRAAGKQVMCSRAALKRLPGSNKTLNIHFGGYPCPPCPPFVGMVCTRERTVYVGRSEADHRQR